MREIQALSLTCLVMLAVLADLRTGKIPNGLIFTGILWGGAYQLASGGILGVLVFLGGVALPLLLLSLFFYFRMIGAGDIKLLCVIGGFLGPSECFSCIVSAVLLGGLFSLWIMLRHHSLGRRLLYLSNYINDYSRGKQWRPYLADSSGEDRFCFSVPVLLGVFIHLGGGMI